MSKADKIDALLESATLAFARDGFAGASLRDVAAGANMALGTVHFYFETKSELFSAASRKIWGEISHERDRLFDEAIGAQLSGDALFRALVTALAEPILRRALGKNERELAQLAVIRGRVPDLKGMERDMAAGRSVRRWIDALAAACPDLSRRDLIWTYSFILGVVWGWQSIDHRYDDMLHDDLVRERGDVLEDIVDFCAAGVAAISARRRGDARDKAARPATNGTHSG